MNLFYKRFFIRLLFIKAILFATLIMPFNLTFAKSELAQGEEDNEKAYLEEKIQEITDEIESNKVMIESKNQEARNEEARVERATKIEILREQAYIAKKKIDLKTKSLTYLTNIVSKLKEINARIGKLSDRNKKGEKYSWRGNTSSGISEQSNEMANVLRETEKQKTEAQSEKEEWNNKYQEKLAKLKQMGGSEKMDESLKIEKKK